MVESNGNEEKNKKKGGVGQWRELKNDLWVPQEAGMVLEGVIVDITDGQYGKQWHIMKPDGSCLTTASHAILQARLCKVKIGDEVRLTSGELKKSKYAKPYRDYKVEVKEYVN